MAKEDFKQKHLVLVELEEIPWEWEPLGTIKGLARQSLTLACS